MELQLEGEGKVELGGLLCFLRWKNHRCYLCMVGRIRWKGSKAGEREEKERTAWIRLSRQEEMGPSARQRGWP